MKTIKLIFSTITALFLFSATAVERPKMIEFPAETGKAVVLLANEKPVFFEISLINQWGNMVYFKRSYKKITDYQKAFNFSKLKDGSYQLVLKINDTTVKRDIKIAGDNLEIGNPSVDYKPFFVYKNERLEFSFLNFGLENLTLNLFKNNELILRSELGNQFTINAGYDLSYLEKGNYDVILTSDEEQYIFSIAK